MNNKPRYCEGTTRYQIVNLMHVCTILTPRTYKLLDNPSIPNVMVKLRKEGVIEKSHNEEIFECFEMSNYGNNLDKFFYDNIPDKNLEYFEQYGRQDIKRAKYSKDSTIGNSRRIIRSGEVLAMMCAAGIPALPDEKEDLIHDNNLTSSVYYQSREIKDYSGYTDDVEDNGKGRTAIATRINGTLLTAGGNYNVYHLGKDIQTWSAQGEYKIKNYIQNMLANYINKSSCMLDNAILLAYDLTTFLKVVNPNKKLRARYDGLNMTYDNLYVLPYNRYGRDMIKIMSEPNWQIRMMENITEEQYRDTSLLDYTCDYYDGEVYTFIFCVPNISRYLDFLRKVAFMNKREMFQVICFDYQLEFVMASIGRYAKILKADFDDFLEEWN